MGTCYSKSGHEAGTNNKERRPKEKRGSKNGHAGPIKNRHLLDVVVVQKDISDTQYTDDSHIPAPNIENCMNKSQQTSEDQLARDANRNIECDGFTSVSLPDMGDHEDCVIIDNVGTRPCNGAWAGATPARDKHEHSTMCDGKVSASDSGIMVESSCKTCDKSDDYSETFETRLDSVSDEAEDSCETPLLAETKAQSACLCSSHKHYNSHSNPPVVHRASHSSGPSEHCQEGENKQSVASIDRLSERSIISESSTDLDKIKLAIQRQSSVGSPTEHRSFLDSPDASYELTSAIEQPEVTTMTMNGRDVVVIDADLFSQIIDEIQSLKIKLSQLTQVIQDGEEEECRTSVSVLSSSA